METYKVTFVLKDGTRLSQDGILLEELDSLNSEIKGKGQWVMVDLGEGKPLARFPASNISVMYIDKEK